MSTKSRTLTSEELDAIRAKTHPNDIWLNPVQAAKDITALLDHIDAQQPGPRACNADAGRGEIIHMSYFPVEILSKA